MKGTPGKGVAAESVTLADVESAARALAGRVQNTPCVRSSTLSDILGCNLWLKFENLQFTASYKERGALNRLMALSPAERRRGVIAMSAGNHAQGVAYHAGRLGIPATIVMPLATPTVKVLNTRRFGANVILEGATLEASAAYAVGYGREHGLVFIHPFDDRLIIAGQGTIALEMLRSVPDLEVLVVPIGGGGLISGVALAAKALLPGIRVVGVQAALYPAMYNRINGKHHTVGGDTLAEGIAVMEPAARTEDIVRAAVDGIYLASEADLERAVSLLITIEKTVAEGAGAAGVAAILAHRQAFAGKKVGTILSGGNIDTRLLASVLTRELAREGRLSRLTIDIPDRPGQLARVAAVIGEAGANIVEVYHQRVFTDLPARGTVLSLVVETRDRAHLEITVTALRAAGYKVVVKGGPAG